MNPRPCQRRSFLICVYLCSSVDKIRIMSRMDYITEIVAAAQSPERFIRATFSVVEHAPRARSDLEKAPAEPEWLKVTIRPVLLAQGRSLQALFQGKRRQEAHNFPPEEARAQIVGILALGFRRISLQCADGDLHVRITRKGKALVSRGKPSATLALPEPHDREKERPLPAGEPDEFLEKVGIMRKGKVLPSMYDKFRQINQFLTLLGHAELFRHVGAQHLSAEASAKVDAAPMQGRTSPIHVIDCGCGRALLTFAAYHFLKEKRGLPVRLTGVDYDSDVIRKAQRFRDKLGYEEVELVQNSVSDYQPAEPPRVVLSLHACDTATDEAIAQGVKWGAELILCAPCCQHELHKKIERPELRAILRHGILRERTADIVTDALRAAALRVMGYSAEVIEFIDPGHTAKNLMIRAEKGRGPRRAEAVAEYAALKEFWGVTPSIEVMLSDAFSRRV